MSKGRIVVVGLGPAGADLMSPKALSSLQPGHGPVLFRTARHPAMASFPGAETFDHLYESSALRSAVYEQIAERLVAEAIAAERELPGSRVAYGVPGSPLVAERSVEVLRRLAGERGVAVELVTGLSFLDLAWERLGIDPVAAGVRLVDGESFAIEAAGERGPLLVSHCWKSAVLSGVKLALGEASARAVSGREAAGASAVLLHHLGLPDEQALEVPWPELDRTLQPDHLTSVYIPRLAQPVAYELARLGQTADTLREKCPWDREQDHRSLVRHLLEESYELMEAIEELPADPSQSSLEQAAHLEEELGDLLFQVYFHSLLAREEGLFELADVARTVNDKLVSRHPHVFGDAVAETADAVLGMWERRKHLEKGREHLFEGVPAAMPALARAAKFERKLESVGLGFVAQPVEGDASDEEPDSVAEGGGAADDDAGRRLLDLARRLVAAGVDPEAALRAAIRGLSERVRAVELRAAEAGSTLTALAESDPSLLQGWWRESESR